MIPIVREPKELSNTGQYEGCCFCNKPSPYWHEKSDVCVCKECSESKNVTDLPTKKEWFDGKKSASA